jgi:hypothetical protein
MFSDGSGLVIIEQFFIISVLAIRQRETMMSEFFQLRHNFF